MNTHFMNMMTYLFVCALVEAELRFDAKITRLGVEVARCDTRTFPEQRDEDARDGEEIKLNQYTGEISDVDAKLNGCRAHKGASALPEHWHRRQRTLTRMRPKCITP